MNTTLEYYVSDGKLKQMNYFEVLQLDRAYFDSFDVTAFKQHCRVLKSKFHPDRHINNSELATTIFQQICNAEDKLVDVNERRCYLQNFDYPSDHNPKDLMLGLINRLNKLKKQPDSDSYVKIANEFIKHFKWTNLITVQARVLAKLAKMATTGEDYYYLLLAAKKAHGDPRIGNHCKYAQESAKQGHPFGMLAVARQALAGYYKQSDKSIRWAFCCLYYLQLAIRNNETWGLKSEEIDKLRDVIQQTITHRKQHLTVPMPQIGTPEFNDLLNNFIQYRNSKNSMTVGDFEIHDNMFELNDNNVIIHLHTPPKKSPDPSAAPPTHQTPDYLDENRKNQANFKTTVAGNTKPVEDKKKFIQDIKNQIEQEGNWKVRFLGGERIYIKKREAGPLDPATPAPPTVPTHIQRMYMEVLSLYNESKDEDVNRIFANLTDIIRDAVNKNPTDSLLTKFAKMLKNFLCRDKSTSIIYEDMYQALEQASRKLQT